tara:strand:+ start:7038 stop:7838 length:801 start_codon:yes stop_codon:yes gene_type:complete
MKAIAASRLSKAQERILGARPFAQQMQRVLGGLAGQVNTLAHPLLVKQPSGSQPTLLVVVTADKGLCGGFNTNIIKEANRVIATSGPAGVSLGLVGRKGGEFFRKRGFNARFEQVDVFSQLNYQHAQAIGRNAIEAFVSNEVGSVHLVYNEFKSVLQQRVVVDQVLPIRPVAESVTDNNERLAEYLYEPDPAAILNNLIPRYVDTQFYRALLESAAAEHAARLTAMEAASNNATEMIEDLTLYMNKVRQATITGEIIEIVSGAEAL